MKRKTASEISCTSRNVNFPLLNGAMRKETVRLRLPSFSLPCHIVVISISLIIAVRIWLWRSHSRKKCCASSIPCPHSHSRDESIPCRCCWALSIESFGSSLAQLTAQHLSSGNNSLRPTVNWSQFICSSSNTWPVPSSLPCWVTLLGNQSFTCISCQFRGCRNVICIFYWIFGTNISKVVVVYIGVSRDPYIASVTS